MSIISMVDRLHHLNNLLTACVVARDALADKSLSDLVIMTYAQPEIERIADELQLLNTVKGKK